MRVPEGPDAGKEKLTAFLIERGTPGFTRAKRSTSSAFAAAPPVRSSSPTASSRRTNLLGEVGKGHHIAFNILNVGRYKLGNAAVGGGTHGAEQRHSLR